MRFLSTLMPVWWAWRTVDAYVPVFHPHWNGLILVLYGLTAASLYVLDAYPRWQAQLLAMGTDASVGNTFVVAEWITSVLASLVSVYWLVPDVCHVHWFVGATVLALGCHVALHYAWKSHLASFMFRYDSHLDGI